MEEKFCCRSCFKWKPKSPRHKDQSYCGQKACQQARKVEWERQKQKTDPDYRLNRKESYRRWHENHRDYWIKRRQAKRMESANKVQRESLSPPNQATESVSPHLESVFAQTDASEASNHQGLSESSSVSVAQTDASILKSIRISDGCLIIPLRTDLAQTDASKAFSHVSSMS